MRHHVAEETAAAARRGTPELLGPAQQKVLQLESYSDMPISSATSQIEKHIWSDGIEESTCELKNNTAHYIVGENSQFGGNILVDQ